MGDSEKKAVWSDASGCRFFLVPETASPAPGDFMILGMDGTTRKVDEAWAKTFEVTATEAQQFFKNK